MANVTTIAITLSDEDWDAVNAMAASHGLSVSEMITELIQRSHDDDEWRRWFDASRVARRPT